MRFSSTVALLLQGMALCQGSNDDSSLQSTSHRRLSYESLWIYEPKSLITDQAAIDLDLHVIKEQLQMGTSTSYRTAEKVYRDGAHSKSVADLHLDETLDQDHPKGTTVIGIAKKDDLQVTGTLMEAAKKGDQFLLVQYSVNQIQSNYVHCQVGANPSPNTEGCFASSGSITLTDQPKTLGYTYDVTTENINFRTIAGFSIDAKAEMYSCDTCPYPHYLKFAKYYGKFDYADHIITSAFDGISTDMSNGDMNFKLYSTDGQTEGIEKAMVYMNIWMYVVHKMEDSIETCIAGGSTEPSNFQAWDEAVAFYTGSRNALPESKGNLLFELADKRCMGFKTCGKTGKDTEGTAWVNREIFRHFIHGQNRLALKDCQEVRKTKDRIVTLMTVPLIQGTIRYAHIIAGESTYEEKHGSEGAMFAMSVLPMVHACNPDDAQIIYENMKVSSNPSVDFKEVKTAFERNYRCMNIKCSEVGGVYDDLLKQYKTDAHPCGFTNLASGLTAEQKQLAMILGFSFAGLFVLAIIVVIASSVSERSIQAQSELQIDDPEVTMTEGAVLT